MLLNFPDGFIYTSIFRANESSYTSISKVSFGSKDRGIDKAVRKIKKHKKHSSKIAEKLFITEKKIRCGSQLR
jgi:hypothetical protein